MSDSKVLGNQLVDSLEITEGISNGGDLTDFALRFHIQGSGGAAVDQTHTGDTGVQAGGPDSWQSFTTSKAGYLAAVSVELRNVTTPATNCTVRIYEGEGATGSVLATETGLSFDDDVLTKVPLSDLPYLENATKYTIRVWGTNWGWHVTSDSSYAGGRFSNSSVQDGFFETYMSDGKGIFINKDTNRVGINTSEPTADCEIEGTSFFNGISVNGLGYIDGYRVGYSSSTTVSIMAGSIEANGKFYTLASNTTHTMTTLVSAFDFHYIYIDDSASTSPTAVIIDSTTEPEWSDPKRGWYNGDDRMVGVVSSRPGVAEVSVFEIVEMGKTIRYESGIGSMITMQANGSPDGTWQTPTSLDGSAVTPVSAVTIGMQIRSTDITSTVTNYMTSAEFAAIETATGWGQFVHRGYNEIWLDGWIALGPSRNVKIAGDDDDDNNQDVWVIGFEYLR